MKVKFAGDSPMKDPMTVSLVLYPETDVEGDLMRHLSARYIMRPEMVQGENCVLTFDHVAGREAQRACVAEIGEPLANAGLYVGAVRGVSA